MEEVRVWQVARTQEQIQDNLFSRLTGEKDDLIAYYTFDPVLRTDEQTSSQASILIDHSLRGNDLEVTTRPICFQQRRSATTSPRCAAPWPGYAPPSVG